MISATYCEPDQCSIEPSHCDSVLAAGGHRGSWRLTQIHATRKEAGQQRVRIDTTAFEDVATRIWDTRIIALCSAISTSEFTSSKTPALTETTEID